jgi:hypothetical protein
MSVYQVLMLALTLVRAALQLAALLRDRNDMK